MDTARQRQTQLGGRLGTALLELGQLAEPLLLEALSEQLGVPAADHEDLREIPAAVIGELSAEAATRAEAVPFRSTASRLDVAMLDVRNLALQDELSFIAGKRVKVHIANEVRIFEALARYYDHQLPLRFRQLLERLNRSTTAPEPDPAAAKRPAAPPPRPTAPPPQPAARGPRAGRARERPPERPRQIQLSEGERRALEEPSPPAGRPTPEPPALASVVTGDAEPVFEKFERRLAEASHPTEVADLLLDELEPLFDRVVLFSVRRREVRGWFGRGRGLDEERLQGYRCKLAERSIFQEMESPAQLFTGVLAPLPAHLRLHEALGGMAAHECLLQPIRVRGRLTAVVYADCGDAGLEGADIGLVMHLAARSSTALERFILRRKLGS